MSTRNDRRRDDGEIERLKEALVEALILTDTTATDLRAAARRAGLGAVVDEFEHVGAKD